MDTSAIKKILEDVAPEKCFWVNDGKIIKNLAELPTALSRMSDEAFVYHVNDSKNDFSTWIEEVIGDKTLANSLRKLRDKKLMMREVEKRVHELKKKLGRKGRRFL